MLHFRLPSTIIKMTGEYILCIVTSTLYDNLTSFEHNVPSDVYAN